VRPPAHQVRQAGRLGGGRAVPVHGEDSRVADPGLLMQHQAVPEEDPGPPGQPAPGDVVLGKVIFSSSSLLLLTL
jgi:hypothetical protein